MKNKKLIAIGCVALVITLVVGMGIGISIGNKNNNPTTNSAIVNNEQPVEELPLVSEDGVNLTMTQENFDEISEKMNSYDEIYITKDVYQYITSLDDPEEEMQYQTLESYETKFTIPNNTIRTYDAIKIEEAKVEFNCDVDGLNLEDYEVNPEDILKIDTDKKYKNAMEIITTVADAYGVDITKYVGSRLDKDLYDRNYEEYQQKIYTCPMKDDFDLSLMGLNEGDYDEIKEIEVNYHTCVVSDGKEFLDSPIIVIARFTKGNNYYTRILDLDIMGFVNEYE